MTRGLYLLFAPGKRPDHGSVKSFVSSQRSVSLSHDPSGSNVLKLVAAEGESVPEPVHPDRGEDDTNWVELLREGLAFDLTGLAPGTSLRFPETEHVFDLPELPSAPRFEALHLTPGHHLTGGERTMPVAKGLVALARDLVQHFEEIEAVIWPPAMSAIGTRYFESVATAWLDGGPFPALGLTAFKQTLDGALQSVGLDFWLDQELRIEPPLSADKVAATRMGVRLVNQLVIVGGVEGSERIVAPDGTRLVLRTSRNGKFIRVWRE